MKLPVSGIPYATLVDTAPAGSRIFGPTWRFWPHLKPSETNFFSHSLEDKCTLLLSLALGVGVSYPALTFPGIIALTLCGTLPSPCISMDDPVTCHLCHT